VGVIGAWVHHWLFDDFWALVWPNVGAVPLCAAVSLFWVWVFRDRLGRKLAAFAHRHYLEHLEREKLK
jgi:hypothetical protein